MTTDQVIAFGMLLSFAFFCALVVSFLLTPPIMRIGKALGLMDEPDERRIHTTPTPRCGGLAIFIAFSFTLVVMFKLVGFTELTAETRRWASMILPVTLPLLFLGLADDRWEIRPSIKLFGQLGVAVFAWTSGMQIGKLMGFDIHPLLDVGLTVFLYTAAMNAYNLIDGMDGVATGLAAITSIGLCGLNIVLGNEAMAAICLALTGACLGFLRYNFHPARVFLGDTGSLYLGFLLMSLTLGSQSRSTAAILFIVPLMTMGIPMIDTGLAIWRRSVRKFMNPNQGEQVSRADKDHLHHRLARKGLTQRKVAVLLYGLQASLFAVGLLWLFFQNHRMAIFTVAFFVGSFVVLRYLASLEMTDSGRWIVDGIRRPGRMQLYKSFLPLADIMVISFALGLLSWLLATEFQKLELNHMIREVAAPVIGGPLILLWATRHYQVHWTRARAVDFFYVGILMVAGIILGVAVSPLPQQHVIRHTLLFTLVILSVSVPAMVFIRIFPRLVQDMLHFQERKNPQHPEIPLPRVLIYGAGYGFTLITRAESFDDSTQRKQYHLIGLVDDDPHLKGRTVHGHPVLGSIEDVETLCIDQDIDEILVSTALKDERSERLMEIADRLDLKVTQSMFANQVLRERYTETHPQPSLLHQNTSQNPR